MRDWVKSFATSFVLLFFLKVDAQQYLRAPDLVPKNRRVLEHQESTRCLTVSQEYNLFLDKCNWEKEEALEAGVFSIVKGNFGGHLLRWTTGPKPEGVEGCLYEKPATLESPEEHPKIILVQCDPKNEQMSWRFENVDTAKYLVRRFADGKCLVPTSHDATATFETVTCDAEDPEHIWRICENINHRRCDI